MIYELTNNIKIIWNSMIEFATIKTILALLSPIGVFLFGMNQINIMKTLVALVIIDFITGVWSVRHVGQPITSRGASRSAYKLVVYGMLASGGHLTEVSVPGTTYMEEIVISFLAITEFISILENVGKLGYAIPKKLLKKLQDYRDNQ